MSTPYSTLADSTEVVGNYVLTQLKNNAVQFTDANGNAVQDVWYGDMSGLLPHMPCLCVIPGPERSVYNGVGGRPVLMQFLTYVMVYAGQIIDMQQNVHASLTIANKIKRFMNTDVRLGGNVIDCFCSAIEPGVAVRGTAYIDATRMAFQSRTKTLLNP